ncbi:related to ELC1 - Elongin C transcription elongation factor [Pseudozyma flocculosa]|uniref:Elongin-C n=2 Tax=Pseudozyma flocculosa TaxID=84751 RepID=A0A5C3FCJ0_9BASI|nr:related to ELC1 - Elongin C transcription elongation factor [Pseudozyma flocculosa]
MTSDPTKDPEWVTLVSEDDYRFVVEYKCAIASGTIKTMLSMGEGGGFAEAESHTARLQIRGEVLEKIVEYLQWKTKYSTVDNDLDVPNFQNRIPPEIALEL